MPNLCCTKYTPIPHVKFLLDQKTKKTPIPNVKFMLHQKHLSPLQCQIYAAPPKIPIPHVKFMLHQCEIYAQPNDWFTKKNLLLTAWLYDVI